MEFTKPSLTFDEQADLLLSHGMVADRDELIEHLEDVGYYRLSGYWRIFRNDDEKHMRASWPPLEQDCGHEADYPER